MDEAQSLPELFPALRVAIDQKRKLKGQFLISGSSSLNILTHISESLAGRMAVFNLSGLSLNEVHGINSNPLYKYLAEKNTKKILQMQSQISSRDLLKNCLVVSYPEPILQYNKNFKAHRFWMENYFQSYIKRDIRNIFSGLNIENYQRFVQMLASSSGQILNASEYARSLDTSQPTIKSYFQIANGTFVWRLIESWQKNIKKRIIKKPKGPLQDTGLINYILGINSINNLQGHSLFGRIWESFVIEELLKGFNNNLITVKPYYYRTRNQAEIDLILEGDFGILPIEIKSGTLTTSKQIATLKSFIKEQNLPLGIIINNSLNPTPTFLSDKILQIPAGCL